MSDDKKERVWVAFAAAVASSGTVPYVAQACAVADAFVDEWDRRFGDAKFLLDGQSECMACRKPIAEGEPYVVSPDCLKFCNAECMRSTGR